MTYKHRIEAEELATRIAAPAQGTSGLQVVVGTAPINMAAEPESVVNTPVIAYNFADAQKLLGYSDDFEKYTLCQSMDVSFRVYGVAPVVFINVLDAGKHKKEYAKDEIPVAAKKATISDTGVVLKTLSIKDQTDNVLAAGVDYIAAFNASGGIDITLLTTANTANIQKLKVTGTQISPEMVTEDDIIGGYDATTGKETGLELIRRVYPKFGLPPGTLLAPGWSKNPTVAAVMSAKTEKINGTYTCIAAIDMDASKVKMHTGIREAKEQMGIASGNAQLLWPMVKHGGKTMAYSAHWAALTASVDAKNGSVPSKSPSNEPLEISAAVLEDGTEIVLDTVMAEEVNANGVITIISDGGLRTWGNETSAFPGSRDLKERYISCRRMMNWYRNHFIDTYKAKVDDPTNYRLIEAVKDAENLYLNSLTSTGDIAGGSVSFNEEENPISAILNGKIVFDIKIAFWTPAEYILGRIEFDPTILQNALGGQ